jgi:hypothetical protein
VAGFTESVVEDTALAWLEGLGYSVLHGPEIAAGMLGAERSDPNYRDVVLDARLRQPLVRLNPDVPSEPVFSKYIRNAFKDGDCDPGAVSAKIAPVQTEGVWPEHKLGLLS